MSDIEAFGEQLATAQAQFVLGDATAFKELWSHDDDVMILGAFGGYEKGWEAVSARLDWAASQFREGVWSQEGSSDLSPRTPWWRRSPLSGHGQNLVAAHTKSSRSCA